MASGPTSARKEYITSYSNIAITQMKKHKIPASITLAQGILESGSGNSYLARSSNNHFGIKCGSQWKGKTSYHDDDKENECFRAYSWVKDSYLDHSLFLTSNQRYAFLFDLKENDYKAWARGLKKAGYATNPHYADRLIQLIEEEKLYVFDQLDNNPETQSQPAQIMVREAFSINKTKVLRSKSGDTFYKLSLSTGITLRQLHKYNNGLEKLENLKPGTPIYLESKKRRASGKKEIVLKAATTLAEISQKEGVRLKSLMKINQISTPHQRLLKGAKIFLR
jgi:LysM repeat protein